MRIHLRSLICLIGLLGTGVPAVSFAGAEDLCDNFEGTGLKIEVVEKFLKELRQNFDATNVAKIAAVVKYPLRVKVDGKRKVLKSTQAFKHYYPKIFTPAFLRTIQGYSKADTVCNSQGIGLAHGSLWIAAQDYESHIDVLRILAVNQP